MPIAPELGVDEQENVNLSKATYPQESIEATAQIARE